MNKPIVVGFDILISQPRQILHETCDFLSDYDRIIIPRDYIQKAIEFHTEQPNDDRYTDLFRELSNEPQNLLVRFENCKIPLQETQDIPTRNLKWHEYQAIQTASDHSCPILTNDRGLRTLATAYHIETVAYPITDYTGRRTIDVPYEYIDRFKENTPISLTEWKEFFPDEPPLRANEFIELGGASSYYFPIGDVRRIRYYDAKAESLAVLSGLQFRPELLSSIMPRTNGQAMLFSALLSSPEKIPIVISSGLFGVGKTFLAIAAGYAGVKTGRYKRIVVCPRDSQLGEAIGAVPGDTFDKTRTKSRNIEDCLYNLLKLIEPESKNLALKTENDLAQFFEFTPLIELGGRSLSDSFIICDEFQDTSRLQAREMITRLGDHSKMVILGDPGQINNPYLTKHTNGLHFLIDRIVGKPEVFFISFHKDECVRHPALQALAGYLA